MPGPRPSGILSRLHRVKTEHIVNDSVTLAKLGHETAGDVLLYDSTGAPIVLANANKAGRLLRTKSAGDLVEWAIGPQITIDGPDDTDAAADRTRHTISYDFSARTAVSTVILLFYCNWEVDAAFGLGDMEIWRGAVTTGTLLETRNTNLLGADDAIEHANGWIIWEDTAAPASNPVDYNFHFNVNASISSQYSWAFAIDQGEN